MTNTTVKYMKGRYIVIIWHQAGGLSGDQNNPVYYTWNDGDEAARVFETVQAADKAWHDERMNELHAGFVVNVTDPKRISWL